MASESRRLSPGEQDRLHEFKSPPEHSSNVTHGHHVFSVDPAGGVMSDTYTATGSGKQLAYGVLEQEYDEGMSNEEALGVGARAVKSAAERDTASGDGVFLAEITDEGVDIQGYKDFTDVIH